MIPEDIAAAFLRETRNLAGSLLRRLSREPPKEIDVARAALAGALCIRGPFCEEAGT